LSSSDRTSREIRDELSRLGAPRTPVDPAAVQVMKPEASERPFNRRGWIFELKHDGFRMLAAGGSGEALLLYKKGRNATGNFPELAYAVAALPFRSLLLDGEVVILDDEGRPNFDRLHKRGLYMKPIQLAQVTDPAVLFVFDLLAFEDFDLRPLPLAERKALLRRVVPPDGVIRLSDEVAERGEDLYAAVLGLGLEGIVAKRASSPYRGGRSADWLKVRTVRTGDFAVMGFDPVPGGASGFRALYLAVAEAQGGWRFVGSVGSGFKGPDFAAIWPHLEAARRPQPVAAVTADDRLKTTVWVKPEIVVEVRYKDWTEGGHVRHAVFQRRRDDKAAEDCLRTAEGPEPEADAPAEPSAASSGPIPFTNLDKVFWPGEGITKGDLVDFYRAAAPWMLPFLRDRPLVLDRYPDGIAGKSFFQKNLPGGVAGRVRTIRIDSGDGERTPEFALCDDVDSLLELVNLAVIPFHIWASRVPTVDRPDWCILDLDPKSAPFSHVVAIARAVRELCEEIELPSFIKTSGGSGLHVLTPTGGQLEYDQVRQLGELLAGVVVARLPAIATTARSLRFREGKVYVDALQNGRGKTIAAPYAVRPRPGAPVSTPLLWEEVNDSLDVGAFNIRTVPLRIRKLKQDPLLPVIDLKPDLEQSLELLAERVG
jgi:bifunctional non-homologous end joining protein LigD